MASGARLRLVPPLFMAKAAVVAITVAQTLTLATKRSRWLRMAGCTTGMRWTILGACVPMVGMFQHMKTISS